MNYTELEKVNKEIKTVGIFKKDYALVASRVLAFRKLYPMGTISTDIVSLNDGMCVIKASVLDDQGKVLSTGIAYENEGSSQINKTSYIENCETSAVGRALGFLGLGIDTSICSAEELTNAAIQQGVMDEESNEAPKSAHKPLYLKKDEISSEVYNKMCSMGLQLTKIRDWAIKEKLTYRNLNDDIVLRAIELKEQEETL